MNGVIIQFFHWYHPGGLWKEFIEKADDLKNMGITAVWFPPAMKCNSGKSSVGYDPYDLYDLGEFDQKGDVATRYGTKKEYLKAIEKAHKAGLEVYADIVLNHKVGGDEKETVTVHQVNKDNRNEIITDSFQADAFTKFTFPGRDGKYSEFMWDYHSFGGIDSVTKDDQELTGIFKIYNEYGTEWSQDVSHQFGNFDYLMGADVEFKNPYVVQELKNWIKWYIETTNVDGLRLDAMKHISAEFLKEWIDYIKSDIDEDIFIVGELWKGDAQKISGFSEMMDHRLCCFDVPLHYNFFTASKSGNSYDLRTITQNTFLESNPTCSVSFVENHDTQKLQALESTVEEWFRPIAYTIILLSENGYPCIFYPDLFGAEYTDINSNGENEKVIINKLECLPQLITARQQFAYGDQIDYFDHPNCIAWIRKGDESYQGCVVIISNGEEGYKEMDLGADHALGRFSDYLNFRKDEVVMDENGKGIFWVNPGSVSVWVQIKD